MTSAPRYQYQQNSGVPPHSSVLYALNPNNHPDQNPTTPRGYSFVIHPQATSYSPKTPWQTVPETYYVPQGLAAGETRYYGDFDDRVDRNRMTLAEEEYGGRAAIETQLASALAQESAKNQSLFTPNPYAVSNPVSPLANNINFGYSVAPANAKLAAAPLPVNERGVTSVSADVRPVTIIPHGQENGKTNAVEQGLKARRYNDEGQFLCGKCGWIVAALLLLALLTLALLFGLGILGGEPKSGTKVGVAERPNFANGEGEKPEDGSKVNGKPSPEQNATGKNSEGAKGETKISTLPGTEQKPNKTPVTPPVVTPILPIVPVVGPNTGKSTGQQNNSKPTTNTGKPTSPVVAPQPNNNGDAGKSKPTSPEVPSQPNANANTGKPSTGTQNPSDKTSSTPSQNNPTTTPATPIPNSLPALPVGTPSNATRPSTTTPSVRPPTIEVSAAPPAPVYSGAAVFDFYPNYVMAQPVEQ